ncbi:MAG: TetR/AcrR family transcriptional regulator [Planctomycetota bacterium]|jgi:AcrR family transcriptional regulator
MADTRKQILAAAREIFEAEGKDAVSMRKVASEVGISAMAIYRHFADKQALLSAIVEAGFASLEKHMLEGCKGLQGEKAILGLMGGYVRFALAMPQYYDSMFLEAREDQRRYPDDFRARGSKAFNVLLDEVQQAMDKQAFRADDPLEVALSIWAYGHGLVSLYRTGRFGDHPRRFRALSGRSLQRLVDGLQE